MSGSLQIKENKYYAVLNLKGADGKRRQQWVTLGLDAVKGNKKKAAALLKQCIEQYSLAEHTTQEKVLPSFTDYIEQWLELEQGRIEKSTWESYESYTRRHIIPYFNPLGLTVEKVTVSHIKGYYDFKSKGGRGDKKAGGLSHASLKNHSKVLKQVLSAAVLEEMTDRNVAQAVPIPRAVQEVDEDKALYLDATQANIVLSAFQGHRIQPILLVTLYYGLRRSEVLGLKWDAVDFDKNTITVKHVIVKAATVEAKDRTKSKTSRRTFDLLPEVRELLTQIKAEQEANAILFGNEYCETGYIFTWDNGLPYRPDFLTRAFQSQLKKVGLPKMRYHDLRHSTASILYDKGWGLKDIQEWLGHSDIETTGNIYTHITKSRQKMLAKGLENTFEL